jgi:hypothetical protein
VKIPRLWRWRPGVAAMRDAIEHYRKAVDGELSEHEWRETQPANLGVGHAAAVDAGLLVRMQGWPHWEPVDEARELIGRMDTVDAIPPGVRLPCLESYGPHRGHTWAEYRACLAGAAFPEEQGDGAQLAAAILSTLGVSSRRQGDRSILLQVSAGEPAGCPACREEEALEELVRAAIEPLEDQLARGEVQVEDVVRIVVYALR